MVFWCGLYHGDLMTVGTTNRITKIGRHREREEGESKLKKARHFSTNRCERLCDDGRMTHTQSICIQTHTHLKRADCLFGHKSIYRTMIAIQSSGGAHTQYSFGSFTHRSFTHSVLNYWLWVPVADIIYLFKVPRTRWSANIEFDVKKMNHIFYGFYFFEYARLR